MKKYFYISQVLLVFYTIVYLFLDFKPFLISPLTACIYIWLLFIFVIQFFGPKKEKTKKKIIMGGIVFIFLLSIIFYFTNAKKLQKEYYILKTKEQIKQKHSKSSVDSLLGEPYFVRHSEKGIEAYYKKDSVYYLIMYTSKDSLVRFIHNFSK